MIVGTNPQHVGGLGQNGSLRQQTRQNQSAGRDKVQERIHCGQGEVAMGQLVYTGNCAARIVEYPRNPRPPAALGSLAVNPAPNLFASPGPAPYIQGVRKLAQGGDLRYPGPGEKSMRLRLREAVARARDSRRDRDPAARMDVPAVPA